MRKLVLLLSGLFATALLFVTSSLTVGYSVLGQGTPYPVAYGFPIAFAYLLAAGRPIYLVSVLILDFAIWYLVGLFVLSIAADHIGLTKLTKHK